MHVGVPKGLLDASAPTKRAIAMVAWVVGCCVALLEHPPAGVPNQMWPPIGIGFLWLTLVWDGRRADARSVVPHLAAMAATLGALALVTGWSMTDAVQISVGNTTGALLMALVYRRTLGSTPSWCPRAPLHLNGLAVAALAGSGVAVLAGGMPHLAAFEIDTQLAMWSLVRSTIFAFIAAATFLIFFHGDIARWRDQAVRAPWSLLLLPAVTVSASLLAFDHERPLTWALLLPAIWAGQVFTPIGAGIHALCATLVVVTVGQLPGIDRYTQWEGVLPNPFLIDILLLAGAYVTMVLALLRDERERVARDLATARWRAESQAALLAQVFDSMSDGLAYATPDGSIHHNATARALLGRPIPERLTGDWLEIFEVVRADGSRLAPEQAVREWANGESLLARGVDDRLLELRASTLPSGTTLILFSDVTAHQRRIDELTGFAGVVAHDLRSPLTGLVGWLEMVEVAAQAGDVDEVRGLLPRAHAASHRLGQVIEDWVSYSLQQEGRLIVAAVPLQPLAEVVLSTWGGPGAEDRFHVDAPHAVLADASLVRQLLANLVGNAVKFARPGQAARVGITSTVEGDRVRVEVADRGIGLPAGEEDRIFDEFHRVEAHAHIDGTGLGLALCRRIVHRHGGTIAAANNALGGTTITFTLPVVTPATEQVVTATGLGDEAAIASRPTP